MGFGLVFIGYLFMFSFPYKGFDVLPDIIGFLISFAGVRSLADYGCGWDQLKKFFFLLVPASGITLIFQLSALFGMSLFGSEIWSYIYTAVLLVYNIFLLTSIYKIAEDAEVRSVKAKAHRNLVLGVVYYAVMLFINFPIGVIVQLKEYLSVNYAFGLILYVFGYIWQFLNLSLIFSCYMWICSEGDENMPEKESLFLKIKKKKETEEDD